MSALSSKLRSLEGGRVGFWCPGCDEAHVISINGMEGNETGRGWQWNSNADLPTFSPSILVTGHQVEIVDHRWTGEWKRDADGNTIPAICHSFVTDGNIQFLGDCTHALANQTVPIPDFYENSE